MDKNKFGNYIKEKRLEKGYTQKQLADLLILDVTTVSKWERGVSFPDITLIPDICRHLDVNEHELIESGNDTQYRETVKEAKTYKILKNSVFYGFSIAYFAAVLICFIVNVSVSHKLSWFFIVLASCLCAFTFMPTVTRFFDKYRFTVFVGSTFLSLALLFTVCSVYTKNYWLFIAITAVLLFYFAVVYPILFHKQKAYLTEEKYKKISKVFFITYALGLLLLTLLLLYTVFSYMGKPVSLDSLKITAYSFLGIIIYGIVELIPVRRLYKLSIDSLFTGVHLYLLNGVLNYILGENGIDYYKINFLDWENCTNGNVAIIMLAICLLAAVVFSICGNISKKNK